MAHASFAAQVGILKYGIGPYGALDRRVAAVLPHKEIDGSAHIEVTDHSCRARLTAAIASEAAMSGRAHWTTRTASSIWIR